MKNTTENEKSNQNTVSAFSTTSGPKAVHLRMREDDTCICLC